VEDIYDAGLTDLLDIPPNLDHVGLETYGLHFVFNRDRAITGITLTALIEGKTLATPAFGMGLRRLIWRKIYPNSASIERLKSCLQENRYRSAAENGFAPKSAA